MRKKESCFMIKKYNMKKTIFMMLGIIMFASCVNKENEFDQHLRTGLQEMALTANMSSDVCENVVNMWNDAIYSDIYGNNQKDINNAVQLIYSVYEEKGLFDSISVHKERMQIEAAKMKDVPDSRKECYDDFMKMAKGVSALARLACNPQGSLASYSEEVNTTLNDLFAQSDEFKMKYADIIAEE